MPATSRISPGGLQPRRHVDARQGGGGLRRHRPL